ncbi:MAG: cysteine--tRNA ligase [Thiobacillaceae bacterium]|nr:cysteine--tRNA ligase [Thiobacillaceae bacterium]
MLTLYNTLSRRKEVFVPIEPGRVRMYVCGMTVYDYCHLGHARVLVVFDTIVRWLRASGYQVTYVRNITDIDDKIIQRAQASGEPYTHITQRFIDAMHEDERALNVLPPDHEPRATEYVGRMLDMIQSLIDRGHAYPTETGDVYYAVRSFPSYGRLSGKTLDELIAGERVEPDPHKRDPLDFALWKAAKPGEPAWPSPWGPGRPGWHIECSAMGSHLLGPHFDIHGGGQDLIFPHHENELAQAEALTGRPFVRIWLHNGLLTVRGERMGKSVGNFAYARDVVARHGGEAVRYFYLSRDWRKPLDFTDEAVAEARRAVERVYDFLWATEGAGVPPRVAPELSEFEARFHAALEEDFTTPTAIGVLQEVVAWGHARRGAGDEAGAAAAAALVRKLGGTIGLFQAERPTASALAEDLIALLIELRGELRKAKEYGLADRVRGRLSALGVELRDGPDGTSWSLRPRGSS